MTPLRDRCLVFGGPAGIPGLLRFILLAIVAFSLPWASPKEIQGKMDYRGMVDKIGGMFDDAMARYREGDIQGAKSKIQTAYFEVFENLEGPIRINISAKKNFELEEEFAGIREMVVAGEPFEAVEKRTKDLMTELRKVLVELEGGYELIAEGTEGDKPEPEPVTATPSKEIEPAWAAAVDGIQGRLEKALEAYRIQDISKAKDLVVKAQFEGYKNTLLETAVRLHFSQGKDYENNAGFTEIAGMIQTGESPERISLRISGLVESLKNDLPGLPLVEGAVSKREASRLVRQEIPDKDWGQVTDGLFAEISKALARYESGDKRGAVGMVQDTYFDIFEASGMEAEIGVRDAGMKARLESHFAMVVGQMKKGVAAGDIRATLNLMRADFNRALTMLGKGADSPYTLFFYSLMIILREGFEAILIITALMAYLTKTGHRDKLRVIYDACMVAIVLSVITAMLVKWVFKTSAASQEILEGFTMLLATVVLFSVSYWLISKAEAQKWMAFIKDRVKSSLSSGSLKALWFTAFLAVYREGAETVLFYQALVSGQSASGITGTAIGFALGCALLVVIYLVMRYGAVKLPIRPFFIATSALLYYMAFVFAGKGVMELIEGKVFEPSLISWIPTISFVGLYPYWQTLIPQVVLVIAAFAALALVMKAKGTQPKMTA